MSSSSAHAQIANLRAQVQKLLEWQRHTNGKKLNNNNDNAAFASQKQDSGSVDISTQSDLPSFLNLQSILDAAFTILLRPTSLDQPPTTEQEGDAFQILSIAVQLDSKAVSLSEDVQIHLADVVHQLWFSAVPSINCRNLLEATLAHGVGSSSSNSSRKSNSISTSTPYFVRRLLQILQSTFSVGDKRSLQILVYLFDVADDNLLQNTFPDLEQKLAQSIHSQAGAQQSAKLLAKYLLRKYATGAELETDDDLRFTSKLLLDFLKPLIVQETHAAQQAVFENLLPPIFAQVPEVAVDLLDWLRSQSLETSGGHLHAFLTLARLCVSMQSDNYTSSSAQFDDIIEPSLVHADPSVRFEALRLLLSLPAGKAGTRRFDLYHLDLHQLFWKHNLTDSDSPSVRTGLVGVWKEFIIRARLSSNAAAKIVAKSRRKVGEADGSIKTKSQGNVDEIEEADAYVHAVEAFFTQWLKHAIPQLLSIKPYRCKIGSLTFLQILLEQNVDSRYTLKSTVPSHSGSKGGDNGKGKGTVSATTPTSWAFQLDILSEETIDMIIACVRSTYEDVRNMAYTILERTRLTPKQLALVHDLGFLLVTRKRDAEISSATLYLRIVTQLATSVKYEIPEGSDAVDRSSAGIVPRLLDLLESRLENFRQNFAIAAEETPVHGIMQAISRLLPIVAITMEQQAFASICQRCLASIYDIWNLTAPTLCRDAEDGADEADNDDNDEASGEQVILNTSWRSIKEASNLLCVVLVLPISIQMQLWTPEELSTHAGLYATWLLQIGHRGVFAHVSQAYTRLCSDLLRHKGPWALLPPRWLEGHLRDILDFEQPARRRSAGLPYLLLGVLSAFPASSPSHTHVFKRLFESIGRNATSSNVIRTHALHCLRVLLQDGKLSAATKPYVQQAFSSAITDFGNEHWGVRNASLLLYAALIQRIFGNKRELNLPLARRVSTVDFFGQYPDLVPVLVSALSAGIDETQPEALGSVFAVLLLLSLLATPSDSRDAQKLATHFYSLVDACASSSVWKVREAGASALSGLVSNAALLHRCTEVLDLCSACSSVNETHGRLLQVCALLKSRSTDRTPAPDLCIKLLERLNAVAHLDQPLPILTLVLEILGMVPTDIPEQLLIKLHCLGSRHYGRKQLGDLTFAAALTQNLLRIEPSRYLSRVLSRQSPTAHLEALSYLKTQPAALVEDESLSELLLKLAASSETRIDNRVLAASLLSQICLPKTLENSCTALLTIYRNCKLPSVQEALLPALATSCVTSEARELVFEQVAQMSASESTSARSAACMSLAIFMKTEKLSYANLSLLLQLLQDDDIAIRYQASRMFARAHSHSWSLCPSRALQLVSSSLQNLADHQIQAERLQYLLTSMREMTALLSPTIETLFAVEKTNMHIDPTMDLSSEETATLQVTVVRKDMQPEITDALSHYERRLAELYSQLAESASKDAKLHELQHDILFVEARMRANQLQRAVMK